MEKLLKKLDKRLKILKYEEDNDIITIYAKRTNINQQHVHVVERNLLVLIQDILEQSKIYQFKIQK